MPIIRYENLIILFNNNLFKYKKTNIETNIIIDINV